MILLTAEVLELKANPAACPAAWCWRQRNWIGQDPCGQHSRFRKGHPACGRLSQPEPAPVKVRAMMDENSRRLKEAVPPLQWRFSAPNMCQRGDPGGHRDRQGSQELCGHLLFEGKNRLLEDTKAKMSLDDLFSQIQEGN